MNMTTSMSHKNHTQLIEQCRHIVRATNMFANSNVTGSDIRERLVIEELHFQAHALRVPSQDLLFHLERRCKTGPPSLGQRWTQLQEISETLLSDCQELLYLMDRTALKDKLFSGDYGGRFRFKTPAPLKAVPFTAWAQKDLQRIRSLVCYRLVIECLPALHLSLSRRTTGPDVAFPAKTALMRLKTQVCYCKFLPSSFQTIEVPQEQNWQSWSDSADNYSKFIHFAKLAYQICGIEWSIAKPRASVDTQRGSKMYGRDNNQIHMTTFALHTATNTPTSGKSALSRTSSSAKTSGAKKKPKVLQNGLASVTSNGTGPSDSGNGAPDEDRNNFMHVTNQTSSLSNVTGPGTPFFDLGQHIQSLLQHQLAQDVQEKQALQQRVLQLEEQCKMSEQKAGNEEQRAEELALEVDLIKQKWVTDRSLLQQQLEHYRGENQSLKERTEELYIHMARLEEDHKKAAEIAQNEKKAAEEQIKAMEQYIKNLKEYYDLQLSTADQQIRKTADQLKYSRQQMLQVQEITKTWTLEDS